MFGGLLCGEKNQSFIIKAADQNDVAFFVQRVWSIGGVELLVLVRLFDICKSNRSRLAAKIGLMLVV